MLTLCDGEGLSTAMANKCEMVSKSIRRKGRTVNDFHFVAYRWVWLERSPANGPRTPSAIDSSSAAMFPAYQRATVAALPCGPNATSSIAKRFEVRRMSDSELIKKCSFLHQLSKL